MLRLLPSAETAPASVGTDAPGRAPERPHDPLGALARAACGGNTEAQRTLLVTIGPALLRVIRGVLGASHPDVEDTLQEALVAVHLALPGFRGECTTLHFACRVAVQTAMNVRRRAGYRSRLTPNAAPDELEEMPCGNGSPADIVARDRRCEALRDLLSELPEVQAETLALHSILGYTIEETAAATTAPVNTARSRLRNALAKLRQRIRDDGALLELIGRDA